MLFDPNSILAPDVTFPLIDFRASPSRDSTPCSDYDLGYLTDQDEGQEIGLHYRRSGSSGLPPSHRTTRFGSLDPANNSGRNAPHLLPDAFFDFLAPGGPPAGCYAHATPDLRPSLVTGLPDQVLDFEQPLTTSPSELSGSPSPPEPFLEAATQTSVPQSHTLDPTVHEQGDAAPGVQAAPTPAPASNAAQDARIAKTRRLKGQPSSDKVSKRKAEVAPGCEQRGDRFYCLMCITAKGGFATFANWTRHRVTCCKATKEKQSIWCPQCNIKLSRSDALARHLRVHQERSDEQPRGNGSSKPRRVAARKAWASTQPLHYSPDDPVFAVKVKPDNAQSLGFVFPQILQTTSILSDASAAAAAAQLRPQVAELTRTWNKAQLREYICMNSLLGGGSFSPFSSPVASPSRPGPPSQSGRSSFPAAYGPNTSGPSPGQNGSEREDA